MENKLDLLDVLKHIDPSQLNYQDWVSVGMALKAEGYSAVDWDAWSHNDSRYHSGECYKKWESFNGSGTPVTGGTIVQFAKEQGWQPHYTSNSKDSYELDWDSIIGNKDELVIVDKGWVEGKEVSEPSDWHPAKQLIKYLEILFEPSENVGYVTKSYEKDGRYVPSTKGNYDRTAGQLIQELSKCDDDIGAAIGDYEPDAGAWIRFNPLDGKGVKNDNVTDFRYALVESDDMEIDKQNAVIRELELPVACLVHSGGKSLHAIVRVEATNREEYKARVDYLYNILKKNGMSVDIQNKNPSRLSRLPGVTRKGKKQYIVDSNIGKESWAEWKEWIESVNDDLPDTETLTDVWDNLPQLSPSLINNVLRQGHKMLIAGPSKAGKSYALIELCCAIAEGRQWLSWDCTRGRILYVNLELDRASCLHRFKDVYTALGWQPNNLSNIDIWNLRGKSVPMDKLAPKLIRRAMKKNYIAIVIDPIYKIITGDENSADQMAQFCNQFDKVCTELGCAVIYCHHHSKGGQGGKKSMDRASGSGVFARDPDALIDLIELELSEDIIKQQKNKAACAACQAWLTARGISWQDHVSQDDMCSSHAMLEACKPLLNNSYYMEMLAYVGAAEKAAESTTAWRIEGTLREFPKFNPINLWFDYPIHRIDNVGILKDISSDDGFNSKGSPYKKNFTKKKTPEERENNRKEALETAFGACGISGKVTVSDLAEYMGVTEKTVKSRIKEHGGFWVDDNEVGEK